jgi:GTP cyclohydrolase I
MTDNINSAHGKEQNIKMNLLKWLNEGKDPYSIIYELAKYLETVSSEPGYADIILNDIRTVYGIGLNEKTVLSDELLEVRTRLAKLEEAFKQATSDEVQSHLKFAIEHHKKKIQEGIKLILEGIGEKPDREGLLDTPDRIARMYEEIFGGLTQTAEEPLSKTFHVKDNAMVLEKDITFYSTCEHHFMPFYGKAHIAYIPDGKVVGLSKLARTVEVYAKRPQIQEQLTAQIADALMEYLKPQGAMVMLEAEHMCMTMRGVKKPGSRTVTFVTRGVFDRDERLQRQFFELVRG